MSIWNVAAPSLRAGALLIAAVAASVCPGTTGSPATAAAAAGVPDTGATAGPAVGSDDAALGVDEFERLHREVQAPAGEVWLSIPWKTSVLDAVAEARRTGRPVLLVTTNGHLLGCG